MTREYLTTIKRQHVGQSFIRLGTAGCIHLADVIGPVQECDIGKRVYRVGDVIQVENDQQRNARIIRQAQTGRRRRPDTTPPDFNP